MFQRVTEEARLTETTGLYRRLCCTRQRMQLVVMAAVLALVRVGQGCTIGCHPTNINISIESCGSIEIVHTTGCRGQCYQRDSLLIGDDDWEKQTICDGQWSYESKRINGCPVTYPVARDCKCIECNERNTHCGHFHDYKPICLSH